MTRTPSAAALKTDDKHRGLYEKFYVERTDGRSAPGQKHADCEYYVLDLDHDPHAEAALEAYAASCQAEFPALAADLRAKALTIRERTCSSYSPDEVTNRCIRCGADQRSHAAKSSAPSSAKFATPPFSEYDRLRQQGPQVMSPSAAPAAARTFEITDQWVLDYCKATNRHPKGSRHWMTDDGPVERTFYDLAKGEIEAVLATMPKPSAESASERTTGTLVAPPKACQAILVEGGKEWYCGDCDLTWPSDQPTPSECLRAADSGTPP